jgi:hypothetical protein
VVDVGYAGSLGRHLSWQTGLDNVPLGAQFKPSSADPTNPSAPLTTAFLVPIVGYSSIGYNADAASSNYHSLQLVATRRFAKGVQFGLSWTWSKAMDWDDTAFAAVNNAVPASLFRAWNYGLAGFDRTNIVKANWLWDVPKWNAGFAPARMVVNGWHVLGIATFSSGAPTQVGFTQITPTNTSGSPSVAARIQVNGNPNQVGSGFSPLQAFNPTVFSAPAVSTLGDPSKVLIRGPGLNQWDISLFKDFPNSRAAAHATPIGVLQCSQSHAVQRNKCLRAVQPERRAGEYAVRPVTPLPKARGSSNTRCVYNFRLDAL